jgi:hypothetical protein
MSIPLTKTANANPHGVEEHERYDRLDEQLDDQMSDEGCPAGQSRTWKAGDCIPTCRACRLRKS